MRVEFADWQFVRLALLHNCWLNRDTDCCIDGLDLEPNAHDTIPGALLRTDELIILKTVHFEFDA